MEPESSVLTSVKAVLKCIFNMKNVSGSSFKGFLQMLHTFPWIQERLKRKNIMPYIPCGKGL
jgi:hypothetical protein